VKILCRLKVEKLDEEQHVVAGWASIAKTKDGKYIVDSQGDVIDPDSLNAAAKDFVKQYRQGGEMHEGRAPSVLVESMVFTKANCQAMGIPEGILPEGWWTGFEVPDATFAKVAAGQELMFSIEGEADRTPVEIPEDMAVGRGAVAKLDAPDSGDVHIPVAVSTGGSKKKPKAASFQGSHAAVGGTTRPQASRAAGYQKEVWSAAAINELPDSAFAVISAGGKKDQTGKTAPRSLRHLPYRDKTGKVDLAHLRNALSRLPQTKLSSSDKARAHARLSAAARTAGVGGKRKAA
jgi:hypothetical protein